MNDTYINDLIKKLEQTKVYINTKKELAYDIGMQELVACFTKHKQEKSQIFFIGNGGSSAIASHMTADFHREWRKCSYCESHDCGFYEKWRYEDVQFI